MFLVKLLNSFKYLVRFVILQISLTLITIWYFDRYLIGDYFDGYLIIRDNLLQDRDRFYPVHFIIFVKKN